MDDEPNDQRKTSARPTAQQVLPRLGSAIEALNDALFEAGIAGLTVDVISWENINVFGHPYRGVKLEVTRVERLM